MLSQSTKQIVKLFLNESKEASSTISIYWDTCIDSCGSYIETPPLIVQPVKSLFLLFEHFICVDIYTHL